MNFTEKHIPITISDIIGLKSPIKNIINWLDNFETNKQLYCKNTLDINVNIDIDIIDTDDNMDDIKIPIKTPDNPDKNNNSCLFVVGNHGVGKTSTIMTILKNKKYNIKNIALNNINNIKNSEDYIDKLLVGKHIYNNLINKDDKPYVIVIDEIESIIYPAEKKFILLLLKKNKILWKNPIIFIANNKHNKFISIIKANSKTIYIDQPTDTDLKELLFRICMVEKIYLENQETADEIVIQAQKDYRRLLCILQDLKINYGNNISNEYINEYYILSKKKDTDVDIYKAVSSLMVGYKNIEESMRLYEGEKVIIPLMFHQNYTKFISKYSKKENSHDILATIANSFAKGDLIENYIYGDQNWDMQEIHGYYTCVNPSFILSNENIGVNETITRQILDFPYDFNRTSIKNINKKNIINSNFKMLNFKIKDFICLNQLIKNMIDSDKISNCARMFKSYNVSIETIESILKIDKMIDSKIIMQSFIKKKFLQILGTNKIKNKSKKNIIKS